MFRGLEAPQRVMPQLSLRKRWISYSSLGTGAPGGGIQVLGGVCLRVRGERSWSLTLTVMRMLYQSVMYKTELRCNDIVLEIKITTLGLYDYGQNNYDDYFEQD